jgi:uncharacterized protein DUF6065
VTEPNDSCAEASLDILALRHKPTSMRIVPGEPARKWMDATTLRFANRCLPLLIANQQGWDMICDGRFSAVWNGGEHPRDTVVTLGDPEPTEQPFSHFGSGIVTWTIPYLFRTPPGWNLLARGPVNLPKDGISALEGVVETDWTETPFTMNWKLTRPGHQVAFEPGDVICRIVPQRRGELLRFDPSCADIDDVPQTAEHFRAWSASRSDFAADPSNETDWQKHYFRGETPWGVRAAEHQTRVRLKKFS